MTIGERIKQRRQELHLTQTELAHRMGLTSKTTICKAETTGFNPTTDRVREFAKALECTPGYLMGWENDAVPDYIKEYDPNITQELIFEKFEKYEHFLELLDNVDPEVQKAVETILKANQPKP